MNTNSQTSNDTSGDGAPNAHDNPSWFERNVNLLIIGLVVACLLSLVAEWLFRPFFDEKHPPHFKLENLFGFQAMFGFAAFVIVVFLGRILRLIVKRPEGYYDQ